GRIEIERLYVGRAALRVALRPPVGRVAREEAEVHLCPVRLLEGGGARRDLDREGVISDLGRDHRRRGHVLPARELPLVVRASRRADGGGEDDGEEDGAETERLDCHGGPPLAKPMPRSNRRA